MPVGGAFSRWAVEPVSTSGQENFAANYISDPVFRDKFVELINQREHQYIGGVPLFLAMSAQLFAKTGELHGRKIDLYEHYITYALEKAAGSDADKITALGELLRLIARNENTLKELVRQHKSLVQTLTDSFSAFGAEDALGKLLHRTTLVRCIDGKCAFSHDLFRAYYRALDLAKQHAPSPRVLREVEPFREGWTVVEQLLVRWDREGQNVEPVLRSLLEYGEQGLQCAAHVIVAARRREHDQVALAIAERFIREAKDTGPTILAHNLLAILAEASFAARHLLIEEIDSTDLMSDTFIAECLLDAGQLDDAVDHLLWVAEREDGYAPDRVSAAELLLKHGHREEALEALQDVAENGDEYWAMVDAASILYEQDKTPENRQLLVDLCTVAPGAAPDQIFSSTLSRLMAIGEAELALPHLEAATQLPDGSSSRWLSLSDAIEAAQSIAVYNDRLKGKQVLERICASCGKMRETAEVARALADLGFDQEARSALRSSLNTNELEIDWFAIDLLVRLDMAGEARSAVEASVARLLDGPRHVYQAVDLIEHARPLLDRQEMSAFILARARSLKEPRLARSLALLGAPEDARSLLSSFLADSNIDLRIEAAGALCELGDARCGQKELRAIVRDRSLGARDRIAAAEKLKSVGLLRYAAFAFARIARDDGVEVRHRTHAAIAFDELEHSRNDIVWHPLMALLKDRTLPVADRVEAAETLIHIDGEDGYDDLVYSELLSMLTGEKLSDRDILRVGSSLGERGWKLDEMPRVHQALTSDLLSSSVKIKALRAIGRYGRNKEVEPLLIQIAAHPAPSVELALEAIDAIWRSDNNDEVQALLAQISRNASIPPAWRLKAAKMQRVDLQSDSLFCLAQDDAIDIVARVEALEALPAGARVKREALLIDIANAAELTFWDRRKIAEVANRLKMPELTKSVLESAKGDQLLSAWEMVELAKLCRELDDETGADQLLREFLSVPLVVLISSEDTQTVFEGLELSVAVNSELAANRLEEMLLSEELGWWSVADALEAYDKLVGRDRALVVAAPITKQLTLGLRASADDEDSGWLWYAEQFLKRGFYDDYESLLAFAENEGNRISERAGACALVLSYTEAVSPFHSVAQSVLRRLFPGEPSPAEQISVCEQLSRAGCYSEMNKWLDRCLAGPLDDPEDRHALARLLHNLGRVNDAEALARSIDVSEFAKGFPFSIDKFLLESVLDEDAADDALFQHILDNDDPLDQIWRAKDYVEAHGDHRALNLLLNAAEGVDDDLHRRLEAIDCLDQLGFRALSRSLFTEMPNDDIEPYWYGAQLLRFGKKLEATPLYVEASRMKLEYNENLVWGGLADLGLVNELMESRSRV